MGKRSRYEAVDAAKMGFAPAFASSRRKVEVEDPSDDDQTTFRYTKQTREKTQAQWTTMDPQTFQRSWTTPTLTSDEVQFPILYDQWSAEYDPAAGEKAGSSHNIAPQVRQQFTSERFLMRPENDHRTPFQRLNASVLGLNASSGTIISQIGDEEVITYQKLDNRAEFRNENNEYEGENLGQMKKRYEKELALRRQERRSEMARADRLYKEWQSLGEVEKEARREKARVSQARMLQSLQTELEEEVPAIYKIDHEALWKRIRDYNAQRINDNQSTRPSTSVSQDQEEGSWSPLFVPLEDEVESNASIPLISLENDIPSIQDSQQQLSVSSKAPSLNQDTTIGSQVGFNRTQTRDRAYHSNVHSFQSLSSVRRNDRSRKYRSEQASTIGSSSIRVPASIHTISSFTFSSWPEPVPIEDIPLVQQREYINEEVEFAHIQKLSNTQGRRVVVYLADQVEFTSVAILDRVFGGAIQEIQYFPDERQALLVFLSPLDAKGFLDHIGACQSNSDHEYARLQIHASFYKGTIQTAIKPCQEGILTEAIVNKASRALSIDKIHKSINKDALLQVFKSKFVDQHLVRLKLVVPKKRYLQEDQFSNSAIIEFASIKQAIEVKAIFDNQGIMEFDKSSATYLSDPIGSAPVRKPWCGCISCQPQAFDVEEEEAYQVKLSSTGSFMKPRTQKPSSSVGASFLQDIRQMKVTGDSYDTKADMRAPQEFRERRSGPLKPTMELPKQ